MGVLCVCVLDRAQVAALLGAARYELYWVNYRLFEARHHRARNGRAPGRRPEGKGLEDDSLEDGGAESKDADAPAPPNVFGDMTVYNVLAVPQEALRGTRDDDGAIAKLVKRLRLSPVSVLADPPHPPVARVSAQSTDPNFCRLKHRAAQP